MNEKSTDKFYPACGQEINVNRLKIGKTNPAKLFISEKFLLYIKKADLMSQPLLLILAFKQYYFIRTIFLTDVNPPEVIL